MLQVTIFAQIVEGKVVEEDGPLLVKGLACAKKKTECFDPEQGTFAWADLEASCYRTHKEVYKGPGLLYTGRAHQNQILMVGDEGLGSYAGRGIG
jgi:hypothetical protein